MADNVTLNAGTGGATLAADEISLVHHQRVKVEFGADGAATDVSSANPLPVDIGSGATGAAKAEDVASASGDVGVPMLTVRQDSILGSSSADGDYQHAKSDSVGRLYVDASGVAVPVTDNAGSLTVDNAALSVTGGGVEASALRVTLASDSTGVLSVDDNGGSLTVDNGGTFATQESGAALTSLQLIDNLVLAEDAAAVSADPGVQLLTVRQDTLAGSTSADGDYQSAKTDSLGRLWVSAKIDSGGVTPGTAGTPSSDVLSIQGISGMTAVKVDGSAVTQPVSGTVTVAGAAAHDAAISGNPIRLAGRAITADYTSVATGDTADLVTTLNGHLVVQPYSIPELSWSYAAASGGITNTTGVTAKAAAGAGLRNYITGVDVVNGHATVSTDVQIRDGAAGTVLWRGFAQAAGGGVARTFDPPLRGTANTLVEIACGTTGSATYFNLTGYTGP